MKHLTTLLIEKYEDFNKAYYADLNEARELDIKEQKDNLKPNEWWKEDDIVSHIEDLTIAHKYRIIGSRIFNYFENFHDNLVLLENIFQDIEHYLITSNEDDLEEIEILLLEGLLNTNSHEKNEDFNSFIDQYAGKLTKKLISDNNKFWENLPNLND